MSFALYLTGYVIFVGGVAWALARTGLKPVWVVIITIILLGIGIVRAVTHTRPKDPVS